MVFTPIAASRFREFAVPDRVKIAWTLEARPLDPGRAEFASETRVVATDRAARMRFRRYWRWARFGIVSIRWLVLRAVRREAEARRRPGTG